MPYVQTKDIPDFGQPFQQVRRKLEALSIKEIEIIFTDKANGLGASWHDHARVDVYMFKDGEVKGWQGSYGGSYAAMYSKDISAQATAGKVSTDIPPGCAALEIVHYNQKRWSKLLVNPCHKANLLTAHEEVPIRLLQVLKHFRSLKAFARPEYLLRFKVTQEELDQLVNRKWIKPHNGKHPIVSGNKIDLAGCQITTEGKNACENVRI
jgi:hypothetical protein